MSNVIPLLLPHSQRRAAEHLAFFVRVGRNDHVELLHLIGTGERSIFGFVIEAHNIDRHGELISEARRHDFDIVLDTKTEQMAFPHGHTDALARLPWGSNRHQNIADFEGREGKRRAEQIVELRRGRGVRSYSVRPTC